MPKLLDSGEIKQIIVVTDGRSNMGISPVDAAKKAYGAGVVVSAIGIINLRSGDERGIEEVEEIAKAGGGVCEYSHMEDLGRTIQSVTARTAQRTIEQIVNRQLKYIIGEEIESLEPKSRLKLVEFIERYGENVNLNCVIALDTSGSMREKLHMAKKSVVELLESLEGRKGESSIAVIAFPGEDDICSVICELTSDISVLAQKLDKVRPGGSTPTGPAILKACELLFNCHEVYGTEITEEDDALRYYV